MRNVVLIMASVFALQPAVAAAQSVPLTNFEIRMVKTSTRPPLRITAETRNPNDFAVRDVEVDCTIKDKAGKDLTTYSSTILGVFQPNQRTTTRGINIGAWPAQGYAGLCVSKRAVRITRALAPLPEASAVPPPTAPSAAAPPPPPQAPAAATQMPPPPGARP